MKIGIVAPKFNTPLKKRYEFPVGLACIQGALKHAGYREISVLNLNHCWEDVDATIKNWVIHNRIEVLMLGGLSAWYADIKRVIDAAKEANPNVIAIGGGGGYSSEPILFSDMTGVDYACIGEGEITICELMKALSNNGNGIENMPGIVWKDGKGTYIQNLPRALIENLDDIPFPDYEGFGLQEYLDSQTPYDTYLHFTHDFPRMMPIFLGRSCPYQCNFCYHPLGNKYRQRSLDNFFKELDLLLEKYEINSIGVHDELFSLKREYMIAFCERIKPYGLKWDIQLRVDLVDEELLQILKDAGCSAISYGIESINRDVLKNMKKHITPEQIEKALYLTRKVGIVIQGNFIFGDEKETWETFRETLHWWRNHREYQLNLGLIATYPGTEIYKNSVARGLIRDKREFIEKGCPFINMTSLSDDEWGKMRAIIELEEWRGNVVEGKILSIEDTQDGFSDVEMECPDCHAVTKYRRIETMRLYGSLFKIPCRACQQKHLFNTRHFLKVRDSEYKYQLYFNLLKQWMIAGYSVPDQGRKKVSFLYDDEWGGVVFAFLQNKLHIAYIVDENYENRYKNLDLGIRVIPMNEIQKTEEIISTDCMVIMDIMNLPEKEQKLRAVGYCGEIVSLFDFLLGI